MTALMDSMVATITNGAAAATSRGANVRTAPMPGADTRGSPSSIRFNFFINFFQLLKQLKSQTLVDMGSAV